MGRTRTGRLAMLGLAFAISVILVPVVAGEEQPAARRAPTPHRVMAFYYPWYGTADGPGGNGQTVHWGRIDARARDIEASTHYPSLGAYDSHDPALIEQHCQWAKGANIDTLILSWWGHGAFSDRAVDPILAACERHGLKACLYYERVPEPQTAETAAQDVIRALAKYGSHPAYLQAHGRPVVFVYIRALNEIGLTGWLDAIERINAGYEPGVTAIGDQFSYGAARVFDGVHAYNTAGQLSGLSLEQAEEWMEATYPSWVDLADRADAISTLTVIPGYDDTKIRTPGLVVERFNGDLYAMQWKQAIEADPHWVLITSFNEWHEGSEIEPSIEHGDAYLDLTAEWAAQFKASPRRPHAIEDTSGISADARDRLRQRLSDIGIAVLPDPASTAFWWLLELGVQPEVLTWSEVVDGLSPQEYPLLLYCSGEHYRRTVDSKGDVDEALVQYLNAGGCLAALSLRPWPFYYDEDGTALNQSHRFGLTIRMGWENPPQGARLHFVQPGNRLPHVPAAFPFPESGDLRWRGFHAQDHPIHVPLLQLQTATGESLGDAVTYARRAQGGSVAYVWFGLLDGPHAEPILQDLFTFLASQLEGRP